MLANVVIGGINVGMTVVAIRLLDRTGRRPLLPGGTVGMTLGMLITAVAFLGGGQLDGGAAYLAFSACWFTPDRSPSGWARCSG